MKIITLTFITLMMGEDKKMFENDNIKMQKRLEQLEKSGIDLNKIIYQLCAADVVWELEERDLLEKMTDDDVKCIIDHVDNKLEIPWTEYIDVLIDDKIEIKKERNIKNG